MEPCDLASDLEKSDVLDINFTRHPHCILRYKWVYWMLVSPVFLYDRCISASPPVFFFCAQGRYEYMPRGRLRFGCSISMRIVIIRYKADDVSGGC